MDGTENRAPFGPAWRSVEGRLEGHVDRDTRLARDLGALDHDDDVVEVVVTPDPADPERIGWIGIGERSDPEEHGGDGEREASTHHRPHEVPHGCILPHMSLKRLTVTLTSTLGSAHSCPAR